MNRARLKTKYTHRITRGWETGGNTVGTNQTWRHSEKAKLNTMNTGQRTMKIKQEPRDVE